MNVLAILCVCEKAFLLEHICCKYNRGQVSQSGLPSAVPEALFTSERVKALSRVLSETSNKPESVQSSPPQSSVPETL